MPVVVPFNDLRRGRADDTELRAAVDRVVTSGWYVHGPQHEAFEEEFAAYCGVSNCVGVASGTDALEIALRALAPSEGGAVLTAANAGGYTTVAARRAGLSVRFADIDRSTGNLDVDDVRRRLDGVAILVVTHLYGRLGPVEELAQLCQERGVALLEDCAQAAGAVRGGRFAGSFGAAASFSFYPTKNLGALGDGGAVVTSDPALADTLRNLRQYGWGDKYAIDVDGGRNSRLDELQAAVLRVGLHRLDADNARRRDIVNCYAEAAAQSGAVRMLHVSGSEHVAHLAVGVTADRDGVRAALTEAGVQTVVHYPIADHLQVAYRGEYHDVHLPETEELLQQVFSLPCFPLLTDDEVRTVCHALRAL